MPGVENWKSNPLHTVKNFFESRSDGEIWKQEVAKYFAEKFENAAILKSIPSLNDEPLHSLHSGGLVRFRCMVQDTYEPEYFLETYEVVNKGNGSKKLYTSRYKDIITCEENCDIWMESTKNETGCRQVLYCVSVPGETNWVKEKYKPENKETCGRSSETSGLKRSLDNDEAGSIVEEMMDNVSETNESSSISSKRSRHSQNTSVSASNILKKNHPLPDENGPVCLVKVYDEAAEFKVNGLYEFIGVLSVDPELSATYDTLMFEHTPGMVNGFGGDAEQIIEHKAHSPPASYVPRLHCVKVFPLQHINPLLPIGQTVDSVKARLSSSIATLRQDILNFLKQVTFGDILTAEYLLCHLISRVYSRTGILAVGKMSLNISGIPVHSPYARLMSDLLKHLLTKAFYLPMSLDNMNKLQFVPTKNYSTNRLDSGMLQLSDGTHMVVDESALQPGQLDENGVKNIQALGTLLTQQKVDYNFQFHPVVFLHDISVLVLSEGKSMLPCDCQVPLKPETPVPSDLQDFFQRLTLPEDVMNNFRLYFSIARFCEYELDESMMKIIENDFVAARQENSDNMTPDDLHAHLVLARSFSVSWGERMLTTERWNKIQEMEAERKRRIHVG